MVQDDAVNFKNTVRSNLRTVSTFALYLVAPYYLDVSLANYYNKLLDETPIPEFTFVLAQKGSKTASSYTMRVPQVFPVDYSHI